MIDDLVKRFVEQLRQAGGEAGVQCEDCLPLADAIEALTEERDSLLSGHRVLNIDGARLQDRAEAAEADNARLQNSLTGIKRAAAHRMKNDPKDLHSYYFHTADAALNTGKEPSHE